MFTILRRLALVFLLVLAAPAAAETPPIYVVLWFDTEDYLLPASDDAAKNIADFLTKEKIRATFKVVGEKARTLERRKRDDVIAALKKHEIGYHSNYHSVQPSPAMYLANLGWDEGVAEFDRREKQGFDDVARIFGQKPSCYGQPGSSWGPQVFGALNQWGVDVYLDGGTHLGLDGKPHYYGGVLTLFNLQHILRTKLGGPKDLEEAEAKFLDARKQLHAQGGGIVSVYYHPCEMVHKEFWDGVNFKNGANPPREKWVLPPQKSEEESKIAYQIFEGYIRFMARFPEVKFITATEAAKVWRDPARRRKFSPDEIVKIAKAVPADVGFQTRDGYTLAPSEVFYLLNQTLNTEKGEAIELKTTPHGPSSPVTALTEEVATDWSQFQRTSVDVASYMEKHGRVPSVVWLGSVAVPPESYLVALAEVVGGLRDGKRPESVTLKPARLATAKYVSDDDPKLWGWVIFPRGFRAPAMMELAKREAWTLKPALMHRD